MASVGEFQLVHGLMSKGGGLSREAVHRFLDGSLFRDIMARRADRA